MMGCCEHGNESSGSIKVKIFNQLRDDQHLKGSVLMDVVTYCTIRRPAHCGVHLNDVVTERCHVASLVSDL
jgi:hypothetical protein